MSARKVDLDGYETLGKLFAFTGVCDDPQIRCPVCGGEYVHWIPPVFPDRDELPEWLMEDRGWVDNGTVAVPFWCEQSHRFALVFGEHKGYVFFRIVIGPDLAEAEEPAP
jgi:hypothetical protein